MQWTQEKVLELTSGYQAACVIGAAAELDVFTHLRNHPEGWRRCAAEMGCDLRAMEMLLDALAALGLLEKHGYEFQVPGDVGELLCEGGERSVLGMVRHRMTCLRSWAQLSRVVCTGERAERTASVRGEQGDLESFITAMDEINRDAAGPTAEALSDLSFEHLLDVGGGPGTYTIAFLRVHPQASATLFDRPDVIPLARRNFEDAGLLDRVELVGGDFDADELPGGADFAWVSAIIHMNSREENRALFGRVARALVPGGTIAIRDIVMEESRTEPVEGALFAINMLVNTPGGGTFTFEEIRSDLASVGFEGVELRRSERAMDSIVLARLPEQP